MKIQFSNEINFELSQIEECMYIERLAKETNGEVYSWKTQGKFNWFEKGYSLSDTLGLVVLERGLPNQIILPNDK
jgi:hypothetical protein